MEFSMGLGFFMKLTMNIQDLDKFASNAVIAIDRLANSINRTAKPTQETTEEIEKLAEASDELNKQSSKVTGLSNLIDKFKGLKKSISDLGIDKLYKNMEKFYKDSIKAANEAIAAEVNLQTVMIKRQGLEKTAVQSVMDHSKNLSKSSTISANVGVRGQAKLAETVKDPSNINLLTNAMYDLAAATYGVNVSQDQMIKTASLISQVMKGDLSVLADSGLNVEGLFSEVDRKLLETGTEAERTALVVEKINRLYGGMAQYMSQIPAGRIQQLKNAWQEVKEEIGLRVLPHLLNLIETINKNMPHIENIGIGIATAFSFATMGIDSVISLFGFLADAVVDYWGIVEPILWAMSGLIIGELIPKIILLTASVWASVVALLNQAKAFLTSAAAAVVANWKIMLIFLAIWGVIKLLSYFGITIKDIFTLVVKVIAWIGLLFWKLFTFFRDLIVVIFTPAKFKEKINIKELLDFSGATKWADNFVDKISGAFQNLPDFSVKTQVINVPTKTVGGSNGLSFSEYMKSMDIETNNKDSTNRSLLDVLGLSRSNFKISILEKSRTTKNSIMDAYPIHVWSKDHMGGRGYRNTAGNTLNSDVVIEPDNTTISYINSVGEVGRINDTVDISSEDLKLMRELAEVKNIQNFVTLTPTVSVQTGDITNGGFNVENVVQKITEALENEIAASAKGVYGYA